MKCIDYTLKGFLALQVIYLCLTINRPELPGWKMFSNIQKTDFIIKNAEGLEINIDRYLVKPVHSLSKKQSFSLSRFICKKDASQSYVLKFSDQEIYELQKPHCNFRKI